jgi:CheY-like chemotaxis protein
MPASGVVLVVDDDPDLREVIRDTLADEGYETIDAADGRSALDYLRSHPPPRVILLDWNMSPLNGGEFMTEVAKDPELARIPVVLLTADGAVQEKAKRHPFVGYLVKPVNLDLLFEMLKRNP